MAGIIFNSSSIFPYSAEVAETPLALKPLDLANPDGVSNTNSMVYAVAPQGADVWRVTLTGDGAVRDGVAEGVTLEFTPKDKNGNTVDLSTGKYAVSVEVEISAAAVGDELIVMAGVSARAGATYQWVRLGGFVTDTAIKRSIGSNINSNSTTTTTDLKKTRLTYVPQRVEDGASMRAGAGIVWTLNSSGAPVNKSEMASGVGTLTDVHNVAVFLGFDAAHTTTKNADVKISAVAALVWTE